MTQKLTRNTSEERWREFWKGVDAAAARAPKLRYAISSKANSRESVSASQTTKSPDKSAKAR